MGSQPTHSAPVTLKTEISNEEVLTEICVVTQPGTISTRDLSLTQRCMDLSKMDIDKLMSDNAELNVDPLPERLVQYFTRHNLQHALYAHGDWMDSDTIDLIRHFRCMAEDN
jgi:hypothetical protein